ncbi:MAG: glycosyltransferase family 4 protein [Pseudomonadota bacterium]
MTLIFLMSFLLCAAIIWGLLRSRLASRIAMDTPNARSLHDAPTPRVGGWGLVPAAVVAACTLGATDWLLAGVAAVLFAVSYIDDRVNLSIAIRLPVQSVAAAVWLAWGPIELSFFVAALATFAIVWITNLFNFMDGSDGLAGGMALFAFSAYAFVAAATGLDSLAVWSVALAGAAAGFLLFNFNPAKVFLGDAGSVTVGFLAGAFGIWGWAADAWPVWFPFLVSAPFFFDATITILRRMFSGDAFWHAHREHYYQRLIRSGWSHRKTALCEYVLMAASSGLAITMLNGSSIVQAVALAIAAVVYAGLAFAIDRRWSAFLGATSKHERALAS